MINKKLIKLLIREQNFGQEPSYSFPGEQDKVGRPCLS